MPTALITGIAGFIGSHLAERLLAHGWSVRGVDAFTDFYSADEKAANLNAVSQCAERQHAAVHMVRGDLSDPCGWTFDDLLDGVTHVFHLAGQPGVRGSWGSSFNAYVHHNILATQTLLEACVDRPIERFVFASSSSVYGNNPGADGDSWCHPVSPYGMTKLAGEALCQVYQRTKGVPVVALRYFTVYGPRQRPDMAIRRFLEAALTGESVTVYGTGQQLRAFTYVADVVQATVRAAIRGTSGEVYNIGSDEQHSVLDVIRIIRQHLPVMVRHVDAPLGDARETFCDAAVAAKALGWTPTTPLEQGIVAELQWLQARQKVLV